MMRMGCMWLVLGLLACSRAPAERDGHRKAEGGLAVTKPAATSAHTTADSRQKTDAAPLAPDPASRLADAELSALLARLKFKPDPYGEAECVSEPRSALQDDVLLSLRMNLARAGDGSLQLADVAYFVSASAARARPAAPAVPNIPRLELVHADGSVQASDFAGEYRQPNDDQLQRTGERAPTDPTWVQHWFASAQVGAGVVAHRITLDGRVLREVRRPSSPPSLSAIACSEATDKALKLTWRARSGDAVAPLLVDVLRHGPLGFVEELAASDARKVSTWTVPEAALTGDKPAVFLVSVTDTFRLVMRGVLVPERRR